MSRQSSKNNRAVTRRYAPTLVDAVAHQTEISAPPRASTPTGEQETMTKRGLMAADGLPRGTQWRTVPITAPALVYRFRIPSGLEYSTLLHKWM